MISVRRAEAWHSLLSLVCGRAGSPGVPDSAGRPSKNPLSGPSLGDPRAHAVPTAAASSHAPSVSCHAHIFLLRSGSFVSHTCYQLTKKFSASYRQIYTSRGPVSWFIHRETSLNSYIRRCYSHTSENIHQLTFSSLNTTKAVIFNDTLKRIYHQGSFTYV